MSLDDFREILSPLFARFRGGGRQAGVADYISSQDDDAVTSDAAQVPSYLKPCADDEARLTIVQITDVYTLDHFASLKTLLQTIRAKQESTPTINKVVSMLTGDFLSPYLLSSVDRGAGMMKALACTPIDILTWGNHEADIDHKTVCKHVRNFPGVWINSNMPSHAEMRHQVPYEILTVTSPDGEVTRRIGLVAVLSNDPKLYAHFKKPGAFGGAVIEDPWETLAKYKKILEEEEGCDLVVPLEHLYVPENHKTCEQFDFPVILSGHDHHRLDEVVNGTRLIKPGMDAVYACVLEIVWKGEDCHTPKIRSRFVRTDQYEPCPNLKKQTDAAYDVLLPLRNTQLVAVLPRYEPLSSKDARSNVCTMGRLVCSMLRASLLQTGRRIDAVILMGGNIRGGEDYEAGSFFSLEMLEAEIKADEVIGVVRIPGSVLAAGIESTHAGDPIPGWMQYDDGIAEQAVDGEEGPKRVVKVAGKPLDPEKIYRVATKISDLTNGQSAPLKEYFLAHPDLLPSKGDYINIQTELMGFFARNLWRRLWEATGVRMTDSAAATEASVSSSSSSVEDVLVETPQQEAEDRLSVLDRDGDGIVTVEDIHVGLRDFLGLSVHDDNMTLAESVHSHADVTDSGTVTVDDFEVFCTGLPKEYKTESKFDEAFPEPMPESDDDDDDNPTLVRHNSLLQSFLNFGIGQ